MSNAAMRVARGYLKRSAAAFSSTHKRVYSSNVTEITSPKARSLYPPQDTHRFVCRAPPRRRRVADVEQYVQWQHC